MIYPLLEEYAKSGHWLGVYPQLTNSWRDVFPFTGSQFIHSRMNEFVDKKLKCLIGYATPSNRYFEFNIVAAAEWSWNSKGRSQEEFCRAYALREGIVDAGAFAEWADIAGSVGWDLAGSRVIEALIWDPGRTLFSRGQEEKNNLADQLASMQYGHGMMKEFPDEEHLERDVDLAAQALAIAERVDVPWVIHETRSVLSALRFLQGLKEISDMKGISDDEFRQRAEASLAKVDESAMELTRALCLWGKEVNPVSRDRLPSRYRDTVSVPSRVANLARKIGDDLGFKDPHPSFRPQPVGVWKDADFAASATAALAFDITDLANTPGEYDVTFEFLSGASGVEVQSITILKDSKEVEILDECHSKFRLGRWSRWIEYWMTITDSIAQSPVSEQILLRCEIAGPSTELPSERRTTQGRILIRKSWRTN